MPQQVYTAPPQPQVAERVVFGRAPQVASKVFGGPSGDGVFGFSDSYDAHEQHEQHRHQQQQQQRSAEVHRMSGQRSVSSDATDSKVVLVALYLLMQVRVFLSKGLLRDASMMWIRCNMVIIIQIM